MIGIFMPDVAIQAREVDTQSDMVAVLLGYDDDQGTPLRGLYDRCNDALGLEQIQLCSKFLPVCKQNGPWCDDVEWLGIIHYNVWNSLPSIVLITRSKTVASSFIKSAEVGIVQLGASRKQHFDASRCLLCVAAVALMGWG